MSRLFLDDVLEEESLDPQRILVSRLESDTGFDETPVIEYFRQRYPPKITMEFSEAQLIARSKARKALANINRQRKKDGNIREYTFPQLILFYLRNPDSNPKDILQTVREAQARRDKGLTAQSGGSYDKVAKLIERHIDEYLFRSR